MCRRRSYTLRDLAHVHEVIPDFYRRLIAALPPAGDARPCLEAVLRDDRLPSGRGVREHRRASGHLTGGAAAPAVRVSADDQFWTGPGGQPGR